MAHIRNHPLVESDFYLLSAIRDWGGKSREIGFFGGDCPFIDIVNISKQTRGNITYVGPDELILCEDMDERIKLANHISEWAGGDLFVTNERLASLGVEQPDPTIENADLLVINEIFQKLSSSGYLIILVPYCDEDSVIVNFTRIYGPKRIEKIKENFELIKVYTPSTAISEPKHFGIYAFVFQKKD